MTVEKLDNLPATFVRAPDSQYEVVAGDTLELIFVVRDEELDAFEVVYDFGDSADFTVCQEESYDNSLFITCLVEPDEAEEDLTA